RCAGWIAARKEGAPLGSPRCCSAHDADQRAAGDDQRHARRLVCGCPYDRALIALRMISAANAASAGSADSAGWWLIPSRQGTKTIALGTRSATHIVSWAAPECIRMYGS